MPTEGSQTAVSYDAARGISYPRPRLRGVLHQVSFAVSPAAGPLLLTAAHGTTATIAACVYAASVTGMFAASALYHRISWQQTARRRMQRLDHAMIFILIAGTYTPFTLITLRGPWGWSLFGVVWGLAIAGIALKGTFGNRLPALSTAVYLAMGWAMVVALRPLTAHVAPSGIVWLAAGGLFYTGGVIFYIRDERHRYSHAVWHLFVLAGSIAHFCAIYWYALPVTSDGRGF